MPYTLWSHGRLVGHTELDIPCVQSHIMQGFIEPTEAGRALLADAAGVPAVCAALERARKKSGAAHDEAAGLESFRIACDRREALHLELRDEDGNGVAVEWIQVNDIQSDPYADIDDDDDEELDEELQAEIDATIAEWKSRFEGEEWKGEPEPDPRWETMQYYCMVYLPGSMNRDDWGSQSFEDSRDPSD